MTIRALSTAATGMSAQMRNIDVIANNIANVSTTGFKQQRANFEDLFYQELNVAGGPTSGAVQSPIGSQIGTGVRLVGTQRIFTQGTPKETHGALDVMIVGEGFFKIQYGDSEAYTRAGNFHINKDGDIVTSDGYKLEPGITISPEATQVSISIDGRVTEVVQGIQQEKGRINLFKFPNSSGLFAVGDSLFIKTAASGDPSSGYPADVGMGLGKLRQGFLESSNVDVVTELVSMIEGQRAYEINANSIKTADNMLQVANNLRG
jgi:flagellar basal-body rod protein FlgG